MNSSLNSSPLETAIGNAELVSARFPELAALLGIDDGKRIGELLKAAPNGWSIEPTPSGYPTLRADGLYVHSRRDPFREGERIAADPSVAGKGGCVFFAPGLAYACEALAAREPQSRVIIVEPDIFAFMAALSSRPLKALLTNENTVLVIGLSPAESRAVLDRLGALELNQYVPQAVLPEERGWLSDYRELSVRSARKDEINRNTLRRFGSLWLKNMCRNLREIRDRDGIGRFSGLFPDVPALLLAAGPSLDEILPQLPRLADRCVVIAVDTALRACLSAGVQPDFTILVDPQYWNWRHLDGTRAAGSILITESAAWPAVFRYPARDIFLCSSLFPLGKYLESRIGRKGELGAGGSVATTAWDFARHLGCAEIYAAGLDLGFPNRQTHFKGSIFEERVHTGSLRLTPAETSGFKALYGAGPYPVPDYRGATVLTDKRLSLYAWWFEARLASFPAHKTGILTHGGMKIPGIEKASIGTLTERPECRALIARRLDTALSRPREARSGAFENALEELKTTLRDFASIAERGVRASAKRDNGELERIDRLILEHPAKEIAAMVFDGDELCETPGDPYARSGKVYAAVARAARQNLEKIEKFSARIDSMD